jgi:hypothetical protein
MATTELSPGSGPFAWRDLAIIETILRDRGRFFDEIRQGIGLAAKARAMLVSSVVCLALYGAVMGSGHSPLQAASSALKLPILFLATLVICAPTLYFFNVLFGSGQGLGQSVALLLTAITVTGVVLLSLAPILLFFLLTTSQYQFFKLLNVACFVAAGSMGALFLGQGMRLVSGAAREAGGGQPARAWVVRLWILVYAFVGSQMAWTLRPFIGAPSIRFELFRQLGGNFYANIFASLGELLGFFIVK